jgi:MarR family 2-MHQ and catechol resistance regulon transcriptional repressor
MRKSQHRQEKRESAEKVAGVHVWLVLSKAAAALRAHAEASISELGLGLSDFAVLEALWHKGPLPVNSIGRKVLLTSGSITTAVDRLERQGLTQRDRNSEDRRICTVRLTPAGSALMKSAFPQHARAMELAAGGLTTDERRQLLALLRKLGFHAATARPGEMNSTSESDTPKRISRPLAGN